MRTSPPSVALEVAVQDVAGTQVAAAAGADRVELCSALDLGGVTPSLGVVEAAVAAAGWAGVHVLVRPRPGDFVLSDEEADLVVRDAVLVVRAGAAGVVVGGLTEDGALDVRTLDRVVEAAHAERDDVVVTFHRAVDAAADPTAVVAELPEHGVDRVLTSGGAPDALTGAAGLARLVEASAGRVAVMAGGGVRPQHVAELVARTGVRDVHLSARRLVTPDTGFGARHVTDAATVEAAVAAARVAGA